MPSVVVVRYRRRRIVAVPVRTLVCEHMKKVVATLKKLNLEEIIIIARQHTSARPRHDVINPEEGRLGVDVVVEMLIVSGKKQTNKQTCEHRCVMMQTLRAFHERSKLNKRMRR